ncbi:MAG TPA: class I SAM-dependent methyltransferase [Thermoanaerobaculia bacterium]|nr:class I SAM-dependent methyltransferase [Thermoanaerobaculia bacterium]
MSAGGGERLHAASLPPHPPLRRYYRDESERRARVGAWFDEAAADYDWINRAMSFGSGNLYRRQALLRIGLAPGMSLLDCGAGTGAVTAAAQAIVGSSGSVVALDPSIGMLSRAGGRGVRRRVRGVAEALPFPDGRFDRLSMGFALRHVADLRATFAEYRRVLAPGGALLLLEITPPASALGHRLLGFYLGRVVPVVAQLGHSGRTARELWEYYWETIEQCVPPAMILDALAGAGFTRCERAVELGVFSEYRAWR